MEKPAVVIVDMLKGFFKGEPVPAPREPERLISANRRLAGAARETGVPVIFIKDNFWPEEVEIDLHFKLFGPHCIVGTPDAEVLDELEPRPGDFQIRKKRYSGFQGTRLDQILRELGVTALYVGGTWTDACVQHTVMDAWNLCYRTFLVEDAVSSPSEEDHKYAIRYMKRFYGTDVLSLEEALSALRGEAVRAS
ncbi:MAG: cysteine hydrolase family protein [Nitrospinota bacterium]